MIRQPLSLRSGVIFAAAVLCAGADLQAQVLEEVVVTATRRAESIQDVPVSVTALGAESMERAGVWDIRDVQVLAPSVTYVSTIVPSGTSAWYVRGIGTFGVMLGFESSVGTFIDGVYQPRPGITLGEFVDVEQVEISRGPQGTLFGRNTSAGAIVVNTRAPVIGEVEGYVSASAGNYDLYSVQGALNVPVSDQFALRFGAATRERDGILKTVDEELPNSNDLERQLFRAQALWEPTDDLSLRFIVDHTKADLFCCNGVNATGYSGSAQESFLPGTNVSIDNAVLGIVSSFPLDIEDFETSGGIRRDDNKQTGYSLHLTWTTAGGNTLTYIPAYREAEYDAIEIDADNTAVDFVTQEPGKPTAGDIESMTHELRFQGHAFNDRLDWLVGAYYADESVSEISSRAAGSVLGPAAGKSAQNDFYQDTETWSVFTHNVIHVTDALSFTLGIRYIDESKEGGLRSSEGVTIDLGGLTFCEAGASGYAAAIATGGDVDTFSGFYGLGCSPIFTPADTVTAGFNAGSGILAAFGGAHPNFAGTVHEFAFDEPLGGFYTNDFDDSDVAWTTNLSYQLNNDVMVYASVSSGFKSGGINLDVSGSGVRTGEGTFPSEQVLSYEAGVKSTLLNGTMTTNATLFYMDIEDYQITKVQGFAQFVRSVPDATSQGVELEVSWGVSDYLRLDFAYAYTDTKQDYQRVFGGFHHGACGAANADPSVPKCGTGPLPNAPKDAATLGGNFRFPVADNLELSLTAHLRYIGQSRPSSGNYAIKQDSTVFVDARAGLLTSNAKWQLDLWGKNLTGKTRQVASFDTNANALVGLAGLPPSGALTAWITEPRTYGATLTYNF